METKTTAKTTAPAMNCAAMNTIKNIINFPID